MGDVRTIEELKDLGCGKPAPDDATRLYHQAFKEFCTRALWNWRELDPPSITQALAVADALRAEGNRDARALAARIEQACRASL
jgi:hypothetical protein